MAIQNFIPQIWNETLQRGLERDCVFVEDCNRQYEGNVSKAGDTVHILGVGKPTIKTIDRNKANGYDGNIDDAEHIDGTDVTMVIDQIRYFNYEVGKVEKAQAVGNLMDAYTKETSEALANVIDSYIAQKVLDERITKLFATVPKVVAGDNIASGEMHVLDIMDAAILKMRERDISASTKIVIDASPRFVSLLRKAYILRNTDNSEMMKNGKIGMYGNVIIKESNNVAKTDSGATDNIMIRTQRAIAYAQPLTFTKAYEPEKKFTDAVKGFILFGSQIVRPNEILNINVKYA